MSRFTPYLGMAAALAVGLFVVIFSGSVSIVVRPPAVASSTDSGAISVLPTTSFPTTLFPALPPEVAATIATTTVPAVGVATSTPKTSAPKVVTTPPAKVAKKNSQPSVSAPAVPVVAPAVAPAPITSSGNVSLDAVAESLRSALVNIVCYVSEGSGLHSISGSGIFIDSKGIILTNAHVAQYFLLADRGASCTIRAGSPAADAYTASLIYISPEWIHANATVLTQVLPSGTGEYDFALLAVTESASASALPAVFPSVPLAHLPPSSGTPVVLASFGAQFLESSQIQSALFPTIVFGSVKDIFTFGINSIDVLALGGSAAAQEGSSGGGVADASGALVGTITTSTVVGATDTRSLSAITASYVRAAYASEMNSPLDVLLSQPTATSIADFASQIPSLESIITAQLH